MDEAITVIVGCDLGDKHTEVYALDRVGKPVLQTKVRTTVAGLGKVFRSFSAARVVIEVSTQSRWVDELARSFGHEVIVANPRQVQLISRSQRKTDRNDAELLARLGRVDPKLLAPVEHRGRSAQVDLVHLRARDALVHARTALVNHVRGVVKSFGARIPRCNTCYFVRFASPVVPDELRQALTPVLEEIDRLTTQIRSYDHWVEVRAREGYPQVAQLTQVQGVGDLVALAYVLTLGSPSRFSKSRTVGAYLGLAPGKNQSGERDPELRISKAGDAFCRRLLVQSAHYILGPFAMDSDLRRWGLALAARGKKAAKSKAAIAVARKLAVLLHRLWVSAERYQPLGYGQRATAA